MASRGPLLQLRGLCGTAIQSIPTVTQMIVPVDHIPRPRERREQLHREHRRERHGDPRHHARLIRRLRQHAHQERTEHRPLHDRRDRQAGGEHRAPAAREHRNGDQHDAPGGGQPTRHAQQAGVVHRTLRQRLVEVEHGRRGERVERAAEVRHRRREDRRDHEPRDAVRQAADDERGKDLVSGRHRRQRMPGVVRVQHQADPQEQRELREHDEAAEDQRAGSRARCGR